MSSNNPSVNIRKSNGELVRFDKSKLREALIRSGAGIEEADAVARQVQASLYEGISTHKIYQAAYKLLKNISLGTAGRYRLKKAMLELGPTGYPFEQFVAKLLQYQGYEVQVGQIVQGKCVTHEVDVVARNSHKLLMVECKYHSEKSAKSDVKVPLYIHSRFLDVKETWEKSPDNQGLMLEGMLVTNLRFTQDARDYGTCAGLNMVSWDHPEGESLKDWIDQSGFHPVTALQSLKKNEKQALLDKNIVLCREIPQNIKLLEELIYPSRRIKAILDEVGSLIK